MANKKITELTSATTPLAGTEEIAIVQGGETKKVAVSDVGGGGSSARSQTYTLTRDWNTPTLDRVYYINLYSAIEFRPVGINNTVIDSLTGRNAGMILAPYNCVVKNIVCMTRNTGSFTGKIGIGSGKVASGVGNNFTNRIVHLDEAISGVGYTVNEYVFPIVGGAEITAGDVVCPSLYFSEQVQTAKAGVTIQIEIEEVI